MLELMSSTMSSMISPKPTLIRVKRRADEEKTLSAKRCKFVGTSHSAEDTDIYQLLKTSNTPLPPSLVADHTIDTTIKILDYEEVFPSDKHKDIITCNGQPLEAVDNQLNDSLDYLYDIYVYEDDGSLAGDNGNEWRECGDEEDDENDENYAYNDYPDDSEVSDDIIDFYSYRDNRSDSQTDLRRVLEKSYVSPDYDLSDEDIDGLDECYLKHRPSRDYNDDDDEEEEGVVTGEH